MIDIVTIDGPVGVGKSSVATQLASRLGWAHLDTGAMYRVIALAALRSGASPSDAEACERLAHETMIEFEPGSPQQQVLMNGENVTGEIRSAEVTQAVSSVADQVAVREALGKRQREIGAARPSVVEGRDMGTVVFPDARWKFYLDADPHDRARRRHLQNQEQGRDIPYEEVFAALAERDKRDRERPVGALKIAKDAIIIDSTEISFERVLRILQLLIEPNEEAAS